MHDKSIIPRRPSNIAPSGSLVIGRWPNERETPTLVVDCMPFWGNPNGDNTADHWYWKYLLINDNGELIWNHARYWQQFFAE